jgi:hypothetical protein
MIAAPFGMAAWSEPLVGEERDAVVDKIAQAIVGRGLQTPAVFALEMHKPLAFVASQAIVVGTPMLGPLIGLDRMQMLSRLMQQPDGIEVLIRRIEERTIERDRAASSPAPDAATKENV